MASASDKMRLLLDQNVPQAVADIFSDRGHEVLYSRDVLQQDSPDSLIAITAAVEGLIVVSIDKDFKRYTELFPQGFQIPPRRMTGRIAINVDETRAAKRIADIVDVIEFQFLRAKARGIRLLVVVSATGVSVTDNSRVP